MRRLIWGLAIGVFGGLLYAPPTFTEEENALLNILSNRLSDVSSLHDAIQKGLRILRSPHAPNREAFENRFATESANQLFSSPNLNQVRRGGVDATTLRSRLIEGLIVSNPRGPQYRMAALSLDADALLDVSAAHLLRGTSIRMEEFYVRALANALDRLSGAERLKSAWFLLSKFKHRVKGSIIRELALKMRNPHVREIGFKVWPEVLKRDGALSTYLLKHHHELAQSELEEVIQYLREQGTTFEPRMVEVLENSPESSTRILQILTSKHLGSLREFPELAEAVASRLDLFPEISRLHFLGVFRSLPSAERIAGIPRLATILGKQPSLLQAYLREWKAFAIRNVDVLKLAADSCAESPQDIPFLQPKIEFLKAAGIVGLDAVAKSEKFIDWIARADLRTSSFLAVQWPALKDSIVCDRMHLRGLELNTIPLRDIEKVIQRLEESSLWGEELEPRLKTWEGAERFFSGPSLRVYLRLHPEKLNDWFKDDGLRNVGFPTLREFEDASEGGGQKSYAFRTRVLEALEKLEAIWEYEPPSATFREALKGAISSMPWVVEKPQSVDNSFVEFARRCEEGA